MRRALRAAALLLAVATLAFAAIHAAPGAPFQPADGRALDPVAAAGLRARFALDAPLPVQYARWLAAAVQGDLGESFSRQRPVRDVLAAALPHSLLLAAAALLVDLLVGIALGAWQAAHAGSRGDRVLSAFTMSVQAVPVFWLGLVLVLVFAQWWHWLPVGGATDPVTHDLLTAAGRWLDRLRHLALPALTLGLAGAAGTARFVRGAMRDAWHEDHVRTARAMGVPERTILLRHVLRDAWLPLATLVGLAIPGLIGGAVLVETVFSWPGIGRVATDAILARDHPLVVGTALVSAAAVVLGGLVGDLLAAWADPRVRRSA
ncbi:MAG: ABC transporter permease [Gemmatimonadaceae bacterium]|nr:ABC transporter permease [Gemmatimonadaceae bacterium]